MGLGLCRLPHSEEVFFNHGSSNKWDSSVSEHEAGARGGSSAGSGSNADWTPACAEATGVARTLASADAGAALALESARAAAVPGGLGW